MSEHFYTFDDQNNLMFNDISETFFDDLKSPDTTTMNEFFSNFTDFQSFPPNSMENHVVQNEINRQHSETTFKFLIEPQQVETSSTSTLNYIQAPSISTAHPIQLAIPFTTIGQKAEPIAVTFDQFQSLINSQNDRSNGISSLLQNSTIIGNNIPLKIVSSTSDTSRSTIKSTIEANCSRPRRKSTHNVIEKRYRSSINEKILELKDIVASNDGKIQKSGILKRTVEFIRQLQLTNARLEEENSTLKNILKRLNLTNIPSNNHLIEPTSIGSSTCSIDSPSTDESSSPSPKRTRQNIGMVNGSRLTLCCFMLFVFITNPFNFILDSLHSSTNNDENIGISTRITSRSLQTIENVEQTTFFLFTSKQLINSMLNVAICFVCLIKLFVYGDPIVEQLQIDENISLKKKGEEFLMKKQFDEAERFYRKFCEKLYVSIGKNSVSDLFSLIWQLIRFVLNLIFVGRWLTFWSGWTKSIDTRNYHRELTFSFVQLWKIELQRSTSPMNLFHLIILTLNSSMNTGKKLDENLRNEIVLLSILTLNKCRRIGSIFNSFVFKSFVPIDRHDFVFLDVELLTEFLRQTTIDLFKEKTLIESIRKEFLRYFLFKQIQNEFLFGEQIETKIDEDLNEYSWWQHVFQLIRCITNVNSTGKVREENSIETIYQSARFQNFSPKTYVDCVETIHRILLVLIDDDQLNEKTRRFLLEKLAETSRSLILMREESQWKSSPNDRFDLAIQTLLFDGILSLRLRLLTNSITKENSSIPFLDDFHRELEHYKILTQSMKLPKQRFFLFESIFRASSGLNPLTTETLFECAMKPSKNFVERENLSESVPNLDVIAAILLFCHFLPSTVFRYRELLQRVVSQPAISEKNFDLQRLQQQCLTLMRQPFLTL